VRIKHFMRMPWYAPTNSIPGDFMAGSTNHLHNVFFSLHDSSPEKIDELISECYTYLKPRAGVLFFSAGARAQDCAREVNDQDFHVALTVLFSDRAAHDAYQVVDKHTEFVDRNSSNWARVRVFDSDIAAG
jgi:stress responsive alpha/beta barrel protein